MSQVSPRSFRMTDTASSGRSADSVRYRSSVSGTVASVIVTPSPFAGWRSDLLDGLGGPVPHLRLAQRYPVVSAPYEPAIGVALGQPPEVERLWRARFRIVDVGERP